MSNYTDFLTSSYTDLGLDLGPGGALNTSLNLKLSSAQQCHTLPSSELGNDARELGGLEGGMEGGMGFEDWGMEAGGGGGGGGGEGGGGGGEGEGEGEGFEFLDLGLCDPSTSLSSSTPYTNNTNLPDALIPSPGPSPLLSFNLLTPEDSAGVSPASIGSVQDTGMGGVDPRVVLGLGQQKSTIIMNTNNANTNLINVGGERKSSHLNGSIQGQGINPHLVGVFPTEMPLSPPYDSLNGSLRGGSGDSENDDEDEDEDEEMEGDEEVVIVKQEGSDGYSTVGGGGGGGGGQMQDPFSALGLTQEQQAQVIQQLLTTLSQSQGGVNVNANTTFNPDVNQNVGSRIPNVIQPFKVMAPPPSMTFTNPNNHENATASSSSFSSRLLTMSPTPPPTSSPIISHIGKGVTHGKGKSRATSSSSSTRDSSVDHSGGRNLPAGGDQATMVDAQLPPLPPLFGGLKGKGGKKGGGMSSVVIADGEEVEEDDIWRPTAEEYKNLSSKEKRQLRNKLSARAFRNRRKDYISELEDHIKDRDRLIDAIRNELKSARGERDDLRSEIETLKKAALIPTPESLQHPRPSPAIVGGSFATTMNARSSSPLNVYNPNKDVPASAALAGLGSISPTSLRNIWGTAGGAGGGYMSVHTAFTPDLTLPSSAAATATRSPLPPQINMNPLINKPPPPPHATIPASQYPMAPLGSRGDGQDLGDSFDNWTDGTAFSHKSLEAYRMQLWSRMARDSALAKAGVPVDMRPKFFKDSSICLGTEQQKQKRVPPIDDDAAAHVNPIIPAMGQVVQQAISTRLFSAFLAAFQNPSQDGLDGNKVSAVFTGKSRLVIVPNEPVSPPLDEKANLAMTGPSATDAERALEQSFANLKLANQRGLVDAVPTIPNKPPVIVRTRSCEEQCARRLALSLSGVFTAVHRSQAAR